MREEFYPGSYVYFGDGRKSFKVLRRCGNELEIQIGNGAGGIITRKVHIVRDFVSSSPPTLGTMKTQGFRPGARSQLTARRR